MEEAWKLVYDSFEQGLQGAWKSVTGSNTMRNEVQFRLQKNIGTFKHEPSTELLDSIEADIQLCGSLGFITDETVTKVLEIIDKQGN